MRTQKNGLFTTQPHTRKARHRAYAVLAGGLVVVLGVDPFGLNPLAGWLASATEPIEDRDANFSAVLDSLGLDGPAPATEMTGADWELPAAGPLTVAPADLPVADEETVTVPTTGSTLVDLGGMDVAVAAADTTAPESVVLTVDDEVNALTMGVTGVVLEVVDASTTPVSGDAEVDLAISYESFSGLVGGDWASRLQFVFLPECATSTPTAAECRPVPIDTINDPDAQTVTATVPVTAQDTAQARGAMTTSAAASGKVAVTAGTSSAGGNWAATSLSPSSTWSAGGSTGSFTWSYPLDVPGVVAGPTPELGLSYSSAVSDGRTPTTNNQSGWIGEGFDLTSGYVERTYVPCSSDDTPGANSLDRYTGDLCWGKENATLMFRGSAMPLVKATGNEWIPKNDDGTRVERLTGGWSGGDDGEYWKVTTTDGTQFFFGRNKRTSSDTTLNSAWTVPVYGNHAADPCYKTTAQGGFAQSRCTQVWRWNLDYVVDPSGNSMTYKYTTETNNYVPDYGQNTAGTAIPYISGGHLDRIEYGTRAATDTTATAPARVVFGTAPRCLTSNADGASLCTLSTPSPKTKKWPDVPTDLVCDSTSDCMNITPVFFDRSYLASITTEVNDGTDYRKIDSWALGYRYVGEGNGGSVQYATNPILRLEAITRAGHGGTAATADDISLLPVKFGYEFFQNRVAAPLDGLTPLWRPRLNEIITDSGAHVSVAYRTECTPTTLPATTEAGQQGNSKLCYPVRWAPQHEEPRIDWFHKYVVTTLVESGAAPVPNDADLLVTGSVPKVTAYTYQGGVRWVKPKGPLVDTDEATFAEFRGFQKVTTTEGTGPDDATSQTSEYFRGLGGTLTAGDLSVTDHDEFAGQVFATTVSNGATPVTMSVAVPGTPQNVATGQGGLKSTRTLTQTSHGFTYDSAGAVEHHTKTTTTVNEHGQPTTVNDEGDLADTTDDTCTRIAYDTTPAKIAAHMMSFATETEVAAANCGTPVTAPAMLISRDRAQYDSAGRVLKTWALDPTDGEGEYLQTEVLAYDSRGRVLQVADAAGNVTTTSYTESSVGQVTKITQTSPDPDGTGPVSGFVTSQEFHPATGRLIKSTDQNGKITTGTYDALGRVTSVIYPQHIGFNTPSAEYAYIVKANGLNAVVTKTIGVVDNTQRVSVELYDGLLRTFQTQTEGLNAGANDNASAEDRGRMVTHTYYDSAGRVATQTAPWWAEGVPEANPVVPSATPPSHTTVTYDRAGRVTNEILWVGTSSNPANEKWRTKTFYDGDTTLTLPPLGGVPTEQVKDARGHLIELREYPRDPDTQATIDTPSEVHTITPKVTAYAYTSAGELAEMTDPAGNEWTYAYDWAGQRIEATDPDSGTTTTSYDLLGQVTTRTNGNGDALAYSYDALGRTVQLSDADTGAPRAAWSFDTAEDESGDPVLGPVHVATRFTPDGAYETVIDTYDRAYRPTATTVRLPNDPALLDFSGNDYSTGYSYTADGQAAQTVLPSIANDAGTTVLGSEIVTTHYDSAGRPAWMGGGFGWGTYVANSITAADGKPLLHDLGNTYGAVVSYTWDGGTDRLTGIALDRERVNGTELDLHYDYDAAGNVTRILDSPTNTESAALVEAQCFDHDGLRRLTSAWTTATTAECGAAAQVTTTNIGGPAPYWHEYTYDELNNRTSFSSHSTDGETTVEYAYGDPSEDEGPHQVVETTTTAPAGPSITTATSWDSAGNQVGRTRDGEIDELQWDTEGELTRHSGPNADLTNVYDASGERLVKIEDAGVTVYLPGGQELTATDTGVVTAMRWYSFSGVSVAVRKGKGLAGVTSVIANLQGTPIARVANTDWAGGVKRGYFDPYGADRGTTPGNVAGRGFLNAPLEASGLIQLGARFYDPAAGAFISPDPILNPLNTAQFNAYEYSGMNPVTWSDPSGMNWFGDLWKGASKVISKGVKELGNFWNDHGSTVVGIGSGILVTAGCMAITAGAGSVGCFVLGGATAGAVSNVWRTAVQKKEKFSWGGFARETLFGAAGGLLGPVGGAVAKVLTPAAKAAASALQRPAQAFLSKVGQASKPAQTPRVAPASSVTPPVVTFSRSRAPGIASNFDKAVASGAPTTLTRASTSVRDANRRAALRGQPAAPAGQSLDEYPFACSVQGGCGAIVGAVPVAEQHYQGGVLSSFFQRSGVQRGDRFVVEFGE